jgi:hypothetical protein
MDERDIASVSIFWRDLTKDAQEHIMMVLGTTPKNENWDVFPIFIIEREVPECLNPS